MEDLSTIIQNFIESDKNRVSMTFSSLDGSVFRGFLEEKEISLDLASSPFVFKGFHPSFLSCMFEENVQEMLEGISDVTDALQSIHDVCIFIYVSIFKRNDLTLLLLFFLIFFNFF